MGKKIKFTGSKNEKSSKINTMEIALAIGASSARPLEPKGLEIIFNEPLHRTPSGLSPGGIAC